MEHEQLKESLTDLLKYGKGSKPNMAAAAYEILSNVTNLTEHAELLEFLCVQWDIVKNDPIFDMTDQLTDEDIKGYKGRYAEMIDQTIRSIASQNLSESDFYYRIAEWLTTKIWEDDKARAFALYWVLIDKLIPYFHLGDGLSMSNPDFSDATERIGHAVARARFILNTPALDQKTKQATLLLEILDTVDGEDRIVLLANILNLSKSTANPLGGLFGGLGGNPPKPGSRPGPRRPFGLPRPGTDDDDEGDDIRGRDPDDEIPF